MKGTSSKKNSSSIVNMIESMERTDLMLQNLHNDPQIMKILDKYERSQEDLKVIYFN